MEGTFLTSVIFLGGSGLLFALTLIYMSRKFAAGSDPRVEAILALLPNADCGGCGRAGCKAFANALVHENAPIEGCVVADQDVIKNVSDILCKYAGAREKEVAKLLCSGGARFEGFAYDGIESCNAANLLIGHYKSCRFGCLGFGDCARICPFGAIRMDNHLPVVDEDKCTGCGLCVSECPKKLFALVRKSAKVYVKCSSPEKAQNVCDMGCISCRVCETVCPVKAITVENNLARIDYGKCINCGLCAQRCPRKIITFRK